MIVHLVDGTYELFRHFYGLRRFTRVKGSASRGVDPPYGAVVGVLQAPDNNGYKERFRRLDRSLVGIPGRQGRRSRNSLSMTEGGTMPDAQMAAKVRWRLNGLPDASAWWLARAIR